MRPSTSLLALMLVIPPLAALPTVVPAAAQEGGQHAAGRQQVNVDVFYAPLAEHGTWVQHPEYQYVWIPSGLDASWRPYQEGRWLWTDEYGWYWDSAEPFAWATYHYGRWGYEPSYGWFWVPGDTWAPAWVTWRRGEGRTGWAPIAPDGRGYAYGTPRVTDPPVAESWVFVEDRYVGAQDLALHVAPIAAVAAWLKSDPTLYRPAYRDGVVTTRFVDRGAFGQGVTIVTRRVVFVDGYGDAFDDARGDRIGIYGPRVAAARTIPAPRRYERQLRENQRILVRDYVGDAVPGLAAPSAALLAVLNAQQRRDLAQSRWSGDEGAYRRQMQELAERQRAAVQKRIQEANRDARETQQKRLEAIRARNERMRDVVQQRQQRAQQVIDRLERERPNAVPAARQGGAGDERRPGQGTPGQTTPGQGSPGQGRPGQAMPGPGTPPGAPQRGSDDARPATPPAPRGPEGAPPRPDRAAPATPPRPDAPARSGRPSGDAPPSGAERQRPPAATDNRRPPERPDAPPVRSERPAPAAPAAPSRESAPRTPQERPQNAPPTQRPERPAAPTGGAQGAPRGEAPAPARERPAAPSGAGQGGGAQPQRPAPAGRAQPPERPVPSQNRPQGQGQGQGGTPQ
jgi:hypothetical protein